MITKAESKSIRWTIQTYSFLLTLMVASTAAQADDVSVYLTPPPDPIPPNVLFLLDESYSMSTTAAQECEWVYSWGRWREVCTSSTRMDQLKDAMTTLLDDPNMGNVNAGILGYTTEPLSAGNNGPYRIRVISDFQKIEDNRAAMKVLVGNLEPTGYTPTVKALEAAVSWYASGYAGFPSPIGYNDTNHALWCQPNHLVLLTDGIPNCNSGDYKLTEYGAAACDADVPFGGIYADDNKSDYGGLCAGEISNWVFATDLKVDGNWPEVQNVTTHTIGFQTGEGPQGPGPGVTLIPGLEPTMVCEPIWLSWAPADAIPRRKTWARAKEKSWSAGRERAPSSSGLSTGPRR